MAVLGNGYSDEVEDNIYIYKFISRLIADPIFKTYKTMHWWKNSSRIFKWTYGKHWGKQSAYE